MTVPLGVCYWVWRSVFCVFADSTLKAPYDADIGEVKALVVINDALVSGGLDVSDGLGSGETYGNALFSASTNFPPAFWAAFAKETIEQT